MAAIGWRLCFAALKLFLLLGRLSCADSITVSTPPTCPLNSFEDVIIESINRTDCYGRLRFPNSTNVIEGDEAVLQKALLRVHESQDYIALLFHASCFSILAKYGVHGFPTLLLLNSTMHMRYRGSRALVSLISFYADVTGIKVVSGNGVSLEVLGFTEYHRTQNLSKEICPFPWAKSPENLLQQETYLALATIFVILRLLYFASQMLKGFPQLTWTRCISHMGFKNLWVNPMPYFGGVVQLCNRLKKPCKNSNLQEGAKDAKL